LFGIERRIQSTLKLAKSSTITKKKLALISLGYYNETRRLRC